MTVLATNLFSQIGKDVTTSESVKQAMELSNLDWEVTLEPLKGAITGKLVENQAVLRLDTQEHLGVVGAQYTPLQNVDAFEFFNQFLDSGFARFETAGCFYGGRKVFVLAKILMDDMEIQKDDIVQSYILLSNSHDGTSSVRIGFTPIRVICMNTLKLAHKSDASKLIRVRHTNQVQLTVKEIQATMDVINQQFITTAENYRWLAGRDIVTTDLEKYVKQVFSTKSLEKLLNIDETEEEKEDKSGKKILEYVENRMDIEAKHNWWTAYNSVQHYMQHGGNNFERSYSNLWFGINDSRNQKALNLALEMAR